MNDQDHHEQALAIAERLLGHPLVLPLASAEPASGADFRRLATVHKIRRLLGPQRAG